MDESREILLNSLTSFGISIPSEISSVAEFSPTSLFSVCAQSLRRLPLTASEHMASFPTSLPDSLADRERICTDVASAFRNLGYVGDISFHKFLYPSEEDLYKLVRFLVERLSELSEAAEIAQTQNNLSRAENMGDHHDSTTDGWSGVVPCHGGDNDKASIGNTKTLNDTVSGNIDQTESLGMSLGTLCISKESRTDDNIGEPTESLRQDYLQDEDALGDTNDTQEGVKGSTSCQELSSELNTKAGGGTRDRELITVKVPEISKQAGGEAFDDGNMVCFQPLNDQVKAGNVNLQKLVDEWENLKGPLDERKTLFLESLCINNPDAQGKLQKLKDIEAETESVLSEIGRREEECAKLSADLEKQPIAASRRSYVERIKEITKNSRKQDADIERILKETRELQLESNSIEERLHRTHAVVDETIFRDAKKDTVSRQAHRLLTSIHESFEEIRKKILETDRTRREAEEIKAKLTTMASKNLDMEKLQADFDPIKVQNEVLERKLQGPL